MDGFAWFVHSCGHADVVAHLLFSRMSKKALDAMDRPVSRPPTRRNDSWWKTAGPPSAMHTCAHTCTCRRGANMAYALVAFGGFSEA